MTSQLLATGYVRVLAGLAAIMLITLPARADEAKIKFDIPPQALGSALRDYAHQSNRQILFSSDVVQGKTTKGVSGELSALDALTRLLEGTTLVLGKSADGTTLVTTPDAREASGKSGPPSAPSGASQSTPPTTSSGDRPPGLEEIVVTAQKRSESLLKVPMAVTAFNADTLTTAGVVDTVGLQSMTPGLVVGAATGYGLIYLRGVGNEITTPGAESSVAVYVDGVYREETLSGIQDFVDLDRVEVLKGPQGTLYGRNALGGAINIITRDPSLNSVNFDGSATVGNYGRAEGRAYISVPLGSSVAFSLSGLATRSDGYVTNLYDSTRIGNDDYNVIRAKIRWDVDDVTKILVEADRLYRHDSNNLPYSQLAPIPLAETFGAARWSAQPWTVDNNSVPYQQATDQGGSITLSHQFPGIDFKSITSYRDVTWRALVDFDATSLPVFSFAANEQFGRSWSQDLQLSSSNSEQRFQWIVGGMYLGAKSGLSNIQEFGLLLGGPPEVDIDGVIETKALSSYAQGEFALTPQLKVIAGLRYSTEKKTLETVDTIIPAYALTLPTAGVPTSKTWDATTAHAALDYDLSDEVMTYVSFDQGFKSGTFNTTQTTSPVKPVDPEKLNAYQIGTKGSFLDRRLELELAGFYYTYKDIQVQLTCVSCGGATVLENAAAAKLYGVDMSARAAITSNLRVSGSVALMHSEYTDYIGSAIAFQPGVGNVNVLNYDFRGKDLSHAPEYTVNLAADYTYPLQKGNSLLLNLNDYYSARYFFDSYNTESIAQGGYDLLGSRASFRWANGLEVSLWGKNLTNAAVKSDVRISTIGSAASWNEPRTYGLTLHYEF